MLNLTKEQAENRLAIHSSISEAMVYLDWLAMYDLLKEIADGDYVLHGRFIYMDNKIRALIGGGE